MAQLLGEMCDGGIISNTESNALKENVEVSGLLGKLFTQVGLPGCVGQASITLGTYTDLDLLFSARLQPLGPQTALPRH